MNSFERVYASFENKNRDRVPIIPHIGDHAGAIFGVSCNKMYKDPQVAAKVHLKALELYDYDITTIQVEPSWAVAEACGSHVIYPSDKSPWISSHVVEKKADLERLEIPDFQEIISTNTMIEGTRILSENAKAPVAAYMTGPLTFSLQLMPYEKAISEMMKNPEFFHNLIRRSTKIIRSYVELLKEVGATIFIICEHDIQLISPLLFKKFSLAYLEHLLDIFHYNILHLCGDIQVHLKENSDFLKKFKNLNMVNIGPKVDIAWAQKTFDKKLGIAGNIDHMRLVPQGSPREIQDEVHKAIEASQGDNRFILTPGCEITVDTPKENVKALVNGIRTYKKHV
ncbi:MAG: Methyltransferase MtaA [Promethearchaeota archaeon]|nr:MAG: Methyltransferase MtaA [Candidatus Lokiarchaeota archaeon]